MPLLTLFVLLCTTPGNKSVLERIQLTGYFPNKRTQFNKKNVVMGFCENCVFIVSKKWFDLKSIQSYVLISDYTIGN